MAIAARMATKAAAILALCLPALAAAKAETRLCNRTSLITEAAIAVQAGQNAATRGWFRVEPGQCRVVLPTAESPGRLFIHTRSPEEADAARLGLREDGRFCVADGDFLIASAQACARAGQTLRPFAEVRPTLVDGVAIVFLAEEADYDLAQARLAGIQRLLTQLGHDPGPVDGVEGPRTEAALATFIAERGLPADAVRAPDLFAHLTQALERGEGPGLAWCNETPHRVMAAFGVEEDGVPVTRGWLAVPPGRCVKPVLPRGAVAALSFAEAVDADGKAIERGGRPLVFGGSQPGCVAASEFEIRGAECSGPGMTRVLFERASLAPRGRAVIRFREAR